MHFEILVEDQSGKKMLELLIPKLIGSEHSMRLYHYKGVGRLPKNLKPGSDAKKRILLAQLPRLLAGFGRTFAAYGPEYSACVVVVLDLDRHPEKAFTQSLHGALRASNPKPNTKFCLAIEEGEAWLLGDRQAVKAAYPRAKAAVLETYEQDSICGTWEVLANAVHSGGAAALKSAGWQAAGAEKSAWAVAITPHIEPERNRSPSFQNFWHTLLTLAGEKRPRHAK